MVVPKYMDDYLNMLIFNGVFIDDTCTVKGENRIVNLWFLEQDLDDIDLSEHVGCFFRRA